MWDFIIQNFNEFLKSLGVGGELTVSFKASAVACFVSDVTADADSVSVALCEYLFAVHVEQLVFE